MDNMFDDIRMLSVNRCICCSKIVGCVFTMYKHLDELMDILNVYIYIIHIHAHVHIYIYIYLSYLIYDIPAMHSQLLMTWAHGTLQNSWDSWIRMFLLSKYPRIWIGNDPSPENFWTIPDWRCTSCDWTPEPRVSLLIQSQIMSNSKKTAPEKRWRSRAFAQFCWSHQQISGGFPKPSNLVY